MAIGLNEAIFVQQLNYWLKRKGEARDRYSYRDDRWWTYNTYPEWHRQFPFWSIDTLKRVVRSVERSGYVLSTSEYNERRGDQSKWYSLDYEALDRDADPDASEVRPGDDQCAESHGERGNLHPPTGQSVPPQQGNLPSPQYAPDVRKTPRHTPSTT